MTEAEQLTHSGAQRLAAVQRLTRAGLWEHDLRTEASWWSDEAYRILGLEPGERPGRETVESLVVLDDLPRLQEAYAGSIGSGRLKDYVFKLRSTDGDGRRILVTGDVEFDAEGRPVRLNGVLVDVTERYRAEDAVRDSQAHLLSALEALRDGEERYRDIVESTAEWIWEIDASARHTFTNPAVESILGYGPEEFLELDTFALIHEEDRESVRRGFERCLERSEGWSGWVIRWRHVDGSYRHLESNARPILDSQGVVIGFRGADRDITERRRVQERMLHAQKMEAVGQLAAGVAHDFNNQLVSILGHSELLLSEVPPQLAQQVEEIRRAGERAAALTSQLLAFGRRQVLAKEVLDLNALIDDLGMLLERLVEEHISLQVSRSDHRLVVEADRAQLECTVANLVTNARDAMPQGGTLTLGTELVQLDEEQATARGLSRSGEFALLTISDDGRGMDEATVDRIFEPFYTTKPVGEGTGLGLATVYGIVKQSGGEIRVQSEPGVGTEFSVYLPCSEQALEPVELETTPQVGTERILVLDDEPSVAATLAKILSRAGYSVALADRGAQALEMADAERFDLVITDAVMPGMGGREVARRLQARNPETKVLLISGYSGAHGEAPTVDDLAYLQKPFANGELLTRVRELLDA